MIVTIDGPAGTGKSTVARRLAEELGFDFLDTGGMYRMLALKVIRQQIDPVASSAVIALVHDTRFDLATDVYLLDGEEVGPLIRTPEVTQTASVVAQIPEVREVLVRLQREHAVSRNIVCEGRDQGTVAFPHAECKFYLTATSHERARRRVAELKAAGKSVEFEDLLRDQMARDQRDQARTASPLRPAVDAILIETTELPLEDVVRTLHNHIRLRQQSQSEQ